MSQFGYQKPLYLLPFDHRATFQKELLLHDRAMPGDREKIALYKEVIYEAFEQALALGVPADGAAVLVDEEFGAGILTDAREKGYVSCLTVEKSGETEFHFQYEDFRAHIRNFNPTFAKVLVRYNPDGDWALNRRQRSRLKLLSDFCRAEGYKLLLEALVPPTPAQLSATLGDRKLYDRELRPLLTHRLMRELQEEGIEPDIWKLEGSERAEDYAKAAAIAQNSRARSDVGVIILGRGEGKEEVVKWLKAGRGIRGIVGFAVGRTIFLEPLRALHAGAMSREETADVIARHYLYFYDIFIGKE